MLATQWSEIQSRYRRFLRAVGQQTLGADEIISPTIVLDQVGGAPFRSDPRSFIGRGVADGAVAPNRNHVQLVLAGGNTGQPTRSCALVWRVRVLARESLVAGGVNTAHLYVSGSSAAVAPTPDATQPILVEPVIGSFGLVPQPVAGGVLAMNTGALAAVPADTSRIDEEIMIGATVRLSAEFVLNPPILLVGSGISSTSILPPCLIGASVDALDVGGVAPVAVGAIFYGEFFNLYPTR